MTIEKESRQPQGIGKFPLGRQCAAARFFFLPTGPKKGRQGQKTFGIGAAGLFGDGTSTPWRNPSQRAVAARCTTRKIEAETQHRQQGELQPRKQCWPDAHLVQMIKDGPGRLEQGRFGFAFGQKVQVGHEERQSVQGEGVGQMPAGNALEQFDVHHAKLIFQACAPDRLNDIARLQKRPHPAAGAIGDTSPPAPMMAGENLNDDSTLAMRPGTEDYGRLVPFHDRDVGRTTKACQERGGTVPHDETTSDHDEAIKSAMRQIPHPCAMLSCSFRLGSFRSEALTMPQPWSGKSLCAAKAQAHHVQMTVQACTTR